VPNKEVQISLNQLFLEYFRGEPLNPREKKSAILSLADSDAHLLKIV